MFKWLFKRNEEPPKPVISQVEISEPVQDEIEYVFEVIKEVCLKYLREQKGDFGGLIESEIRDLEEKYGMVFPKAYNTFLRKFAGGQLKIFCCQSYDLKGIYEAQEVSKELVLQDGASLPENYFAFSQWQGYQFYYFINSNSENPETFLYLEGGNDTIANPPQIYPQGSFTDWIINLSINNIALIGSLEGRAVEGGINRLKGLLLRNKKDGSVNNGA